MSEEVAMPVLERPPKSSGGWKSPDRREANGSVHLTDAPARPLPGPNLIVRWVFYASIFAIPFYRLYVPGTGERIGVTRIVQVLLLVAFLAQPRVCLRHIPVALLCFGAYCGVRILWGFWLAPELFDSWWPGTFVLMQFFLPWLWFLFNVLQYPEMGRRAIWALACGVSLCAGLHLLGIGAVELDNGAEGRSAMFGETANLGGAIYALGLIAMVGLAMLRNTELSARLTVFPLLAVVATALAKTGSRTAALLVTAGLLVLLFHQTAFAPRIKRYVTLLLMSAVLAGAVYQVPTVAMRFQTVTALNPRTGEARARLYSALWDMFLRSPFYGTGPEAYQNELTRRAMPWWFEKQRTITSHNLALRLLVETGMAGFAVFMAGVAIAMGAAWRARLGSCGLVPLAMLLPLATIGSVLNDPISNPAYWFAIAYALAGRS